jgi:hypothetical protein
MDHYIYDYQFTTPAGIGVYICNTVYRGKQDLKMSQFPLSASTVNPASSTTGSNITQQGANTEAGCWLLCVREVLWTTIKVK